MSARFMPQTSSVSSSASVWNGQFARVIASRVAGFEALLRERVDTAR